MPNEPGGVLWFLEEVNRTQSTIPDTGPIVVHCRYNQDGRTLFYNCKYARSVMSDLFFRRYQQQQLIKSHLVYTPLCTQTHMNQKPEGSVTIIMKTSRMSGEDNYSVVSLLRRRAECQYELIQFHLSTHTYCTVFG